MPKLWSGFIRDVPARTSEQVIDKLKSYFQDKSVCDVGCGEGDVITMILKYTDRVCGVDWSMERLQPAIDRELNVTQGNAEHDRLPFADVYYAWIEVGQGQQFKLDNIIKNICIVNPKAIILIPTDMNDLNEIENLNYLSKHYKVGIIECPYDDGDKWRQKGLVHVNILENIVMR
jgi:SAM-dependent methyltransferase